MTETPELRAQYHAALQIAALRHTVLSLATTVMVLALQIAAYHVTDRWWSTAINIGATVGGIAVITTVLVQHLRTCAALKRRYCGDTTIP